MIRGNQCVIRLVILIVTCLPITVAYAVIHHVLNTVRVRETSAMSAS